MARKTTRDKAFDEVEEMLVRLKTERYQAAKDCRECLDFAGKLDNESRASELAGALVELRKLRAQVKP